MQSTLSCKSSVFFLNSFSVLVPFQFNSRWSRNIYCLLFFLFILYSSSLMLMKQLLLLLFLLHSFSVETIIALKKIVVSMHSFIYTSRHHESSRLSIPTAHVVVVVFVLIPSFRAMKAVDVRPKIIHCCCCLPSSSST